MSKNSCDIVFKMNKFFDNIKKLGRLGLEKLIGKSLGQKASSYYSNGDIKNCALPSDDLITLTHTL